MIRIVKLTFKEEFVQSFLDLFEERKNKIRHVEGCQHLQLWQDHSLKTSFYTYSIWNEAQDLENYRQSELFKDTWITVKEWFDDKPLAFSTDKLIELS